MRAAYLERLGEHLAWLDDRCEAAGLFLERFVTDESLATSFLGLLRRLAGPGAGTGAEANR